MARTVVLDQSTPRLKGLQVNGTLVFKNKNLSLTSGWIMVHGKLQIGTAGRRSRAGPASCSPATTRTRTCWA